MKSYSNHLKTTQSFGEILPTNYRPTMRSSAVFPVRIEKGTLDTVVGFLGYWMLKRDIKEVTVLLTVRSEEGSTIAIESIHVDAVRSFRISVADLLERSGLGIVASFLGSIEVEVFSARDLVFPFPAVTLSYESPLGISFVHSCGRTYNDIHDFQANDEQQVPETGFDIIPDNGFEPFFAFVNGPLPITSEDLTLEFINTSGERLSKVRTIEEVPAYGVVWFDVFSGQDERNHLKGNRGTVKIHHDFKGFFPRFVAGNSIGGQRGVSLTHSYYDTQADQSDSAKWTNGNAELFHDSVISFPISDAFDFTELAVYPIFARHPVNLAFQFFTGDGTFIGEKSNVAEIADVEVKVQYLDATQILKDIRPSPGLALCKVLIDGGGTVPTRMKFGLNMGVRSGAMLPSNICFGAAIPNPNLLEKPGTFRWCTVFDAEHQYVFLTNTSFVKGYDRPAALSLSLWRERDGESLEWRERILANGVVEVLGDRAPEIAAFLAGETGWLTVRSDNPFVSGYYVTDFGQGMIGADHVY